MPRSKEEWEEVRKKREKAGTPEMRQIMALEEIADGIVRLSEAVQALPVALLRAFPTKK
jgi:hypothetical protein